MPVYAVFTMPVLTPQMYSLALDYVELHMPLTGLITLGVIVVGLLVVKLIRHYCSLLVYYGPTR